MISGEAKTGYVITNSHTPELTNISGEKIWDDGNNQDGKRPESITVNLFANGEKIDSKAVKADAEGNWKYSFKNLPKYANGQLISYTVTEDVVPGVYDGNFRNHHHQQVPARKDQHQRNKGMGRWK